MNWFLVLTLLFTIVSAALVLIVLVQRPQGGGLAGAFGGAGGGGTDSVFGGRVGDALTWATVVAFCVFFSLAVILNLDFLQPRPGIAVPPEGVNITGGLDTGAAGGIGEPALPTPPAEGSPLGTP
ncbi:MAG: preprotein translocase subunit SecG [Phycisphaeraceae bacterium]|nr:preprotein translocase subunit SecG [Phycisphaeraceae bacterium]